MKQSAKILFMAVILLSFAGCIKRDKFSKIPKITYKDFILYQDLTADLTFSFTDGDGNVGFKQGDTLPPYHREGDHYYNFYMDYYVKIDGEFEKIEPTLPFYYRIPHLTPEGKNKTLQGTITVQDITPFPITLPYDTVKFTFYMEDLDFNKSNIQSTPEIIRRR